MKAPLPWQLQQWQMLLSQAEQGRLAHAYLFVGEEGLGKRQLAQQLARVLVCKHRQAGQTCDRCEDCRLSDYGSHPDIMLVEAEENSRDIKIEQIRAVTEYSVRTSHAGGYKIIIIDQCHRMNASAANALLKTLEEPVAGTCLLLLSHLPGRLLPTLRSRCQRVVMPTPPMGLVADWLCQQGIDSSRARALAAATDRRPLLALQLDADDGLNQREEFVGSLFALPLQPQTLQGTLTLAGNIGEEPTLRYLSYSSSIVIKKLLQTGESSYDMLAGTPDSAGSANLQGMGNIESIESQKSLESLESNLKSLDKLLSWLSEQGKARQDWLAKLLVLQQQIEQARRQLDSGSNPNPQLIVESLLWRWQKLMQQ